MKQLKFRELAVEMARLGETQTDVANLLNIPTSSISRRFKGEYKWTEKEKEKLSKHYKLKKEDLFKEV